MAKKQNYENYIDPEDMYDTVSEVENIEPETMEEEIVEKIPEVSAFGIEEEKVEQEEPIKETVKKNVINGVVTLVTPKGVYVTMPDGSQQFIYGGHKKYKIGDFAPIEL